MVEKGHNAQTRRSVCSNRCRGYLQSGRWPQSQVPASHPVRSTPVPKDHKARRRLRGARFIGSWCRHCGASIVIDRLTPNAQNYVYCTELCRTRERGRLMKIRGVAIDRYAIYVRDGHRCYLCRRLVRHDLRVPHPLAATIDHVVPLARGGDHIEANLRTACFRCNTHKGDRGGGEQLALL